LGALDFLRKGKRVVQLRRTPAFLQGKNCIAALQRHLAELGHEMYAVDLTTPDVASCGYFVVKVLIPSLQPLEGDHSHRFLGGNRLYTLPERLGYPGERSFESLNPLPHPYP
jgi:ribosomal protein S12 methylthiotransferase accessory factor